MQKPQTLEQRVTELEKNLETLTSIIANQNEIIKAMNNGQMREIEKTIKSITHQQEDIEQKLGNFQV